PRCPAVSNRDMRSLMGTRKLRHLHACRPPAAPSLGTYFLFAKPDSNPAALLIAERAHWLDARGAVRRHDVGQDADSYQYEGDGAERERVGRTHAEDQRSDQAAKGQSGSEADDDAEKDGLHTVGDDEFQDVRICGTQGHANADFPNAAAHRVRQDPVNADG